MPGSLGPCGMRLRSWWRPGGGVLLCHRSSIGNRRQSRSRPRWRSQWPVSLNAGLPLRDLIILVLGLDRRAWRGRGACRPGRLNPLACAAALLHDRNASRGLAIIPRAVSDGDEVAIVRSIRLRTSSAAARRNKRQQGPNVARWCAAVDRVARHFIVAMPRQSPTGALARIETPVVIGVLAIRRKEQHSARRAVRLRPRRPRGQKVVKTDGGFRYCTDLRRSKSESAAGVRGGRFADHQRGRQFSLLRPRSGHFVLVLLATQTLGNHQTTPPARTGEASRRTRSPPDEPGGI